MWYLGAVDTLQGFASVSLKCESEKKRGAASKEKYLLL